MNTTIQRHFYRNGQIREESPTQNGRRHGVVRTWHKSGGLASEETFQNGLLHGTCRQWDESGRVLGKYVMTCGTGVQRSWHDNGQLQLEVSTLRGEFCGRNRIWLRDGTLISECFYLHGRTVSAEEYREAARRDRTLPKVRATRVKPLPGGLAKQKRIHRTFVSGLLEKQNRREANAWLQEHARDKTPRSLGRFKSARAAVTFVKEIYDAGAVKVIAPDIYDNKAGDEFADCLLVKLPKEAERRKAVRAVCMKLRRRKLGAVEPHEDIGESHLYLSLA